MVSLLSAYIESLARMVRVCMDLLEQLEVGLEEELKFS